MEKFLAKQNKFDEAAVAHAESEELSKREMAMCQAMANRDYHNEKEKLIEKQESDMTLLLQTREHWREVLLSRQKQEKDYFYRREAVVEIMEQEPLRTREAQLNVKTAKSRSPNKSKNSARLLKSAEISFQYCTVLPPLAPPVTGNNSQASSEYGGNKGRASSQCGSAKSRSSNSSRSGSNSRRQDRNMENDE
ncbi:hypothetical protein TRFO_28459 [Tritrichomonas foetus]|uniref:Uncharacterized protein n=1 Tax=Tritrichomonas foetus TaxID=1144522 RepID=A0A1J4JYP5_9EUKA|nr:hypothetical protein TRFO_28459 [Tritrichomonas foetus]|eukprot:OHT04091.1 hypothetical protein TRFO_28459 [Tritrichomonas foetus]